LPEGITALETNNNYNSKQKINCDYHGKGEGNMDWFEKNPIENKEIPVTEYVRYLASFDARKYSGHLER